MAEVISSNSASTMTISTDRSTPTGPYLGRMTKSRYHMENVMRFRQCSMEGGSVYTVRRLGQTSGKCWNPSDCYCVKCTAVVRFRANWPISIVSYGFYGPWGKGPGGKYHMEIELLTEDFISIAKTQKVTPFIQPEELFHVKFDDPAPILPCTSYYAKFSLLGPPTGESPSCACKNPLKIVQCGDDRVEFTFEEPESNQLPEISFTLTY